MAKPKPAPTPPAEPPKRPLLSRWELFMLLAAAALLIFFALRQFGISPVEVTEESEIIDRPHR